MKIISSKDNAIYKKAQKLTRRKYRDEEGLYLLEGIKPLEDALEYGCQVERIFVSEDSDWQFSGNERTIVLDKKLFAELSDTRSSQGVIAVLKQQEYDDGMLRRIIEEPGQLIVLDRIQDPGNMGTIIRTAEAAGFKGVVLMSGCVDPYSPKVVRSTAGSLLRMPILQKVSEQELLDAIEPSERVLVVTALEGAIDYRDADLNRDVAIVIGNEGQGVSDCFIGNADLKIKIPMAGAIESLNAAVAAGILMYESQNK